MLGHEIERCPPSALLLKVSRLSKVGEAFVNPETRRLKRRVRQLVNDG